MDPKACLNEGFAALAEGDRTTARERLQAYDRWRKHFGFEPRMDDGSTGDEASNRLARYIDKSYCDERKYR